MTDRYEVKDMGDGNAWVLDTWTGNALATEDGSRTYVAPVMNARWVIGFMNTSPKNRVRPDSDGTPVSHVQDMTDVVEAAFASPVRDVDGGDFDPTDRDQSAETYLTDYQARHAAWKARQTPDEGRAHVWRSAAYRSGIDGAEKRLREALDALPDTTANIKSRVKIESALDALESAREVAEDENPYM